MGPSNGSFGASPGGQGGVLCERSTVGEVAGVGVWAASLVLELALQGVMPLLPAGERPDVPGGPGRSPMQHRAQSRGSRLEGDRKVHRWQLGLSGMHWHRHPPRTMTVPNTPPTASPDSWVLCTTWDTCQGCPQNDSRKTFPLLLQRVVNLHKRTRLIPAPERFRPGDDEPDWLLFTCSHTQNRGQVDNPRGMETWTRVDLSRWGLHDTLDCRAPELGSFL